MSQFVNEIKDILHGHDSPCLMSTIKNRIQKQNHRKVKELGVDNPERLAEFGRYTRLHHGTDKASPEGIRARFKVSQLA